MTAAASEGVAPVLEGLEAGTLPDGVRLVLVRHGETDWNMVRRIQGQLDEPLNAVGVQQAKAAAARFAPGMVDAIPKPTGASRRGIRIWTCRAARA